jgi:hypothetical protein
VHEVGSLGRKDARERSGLEKRDGRGVAAGTPCDEPRAGVPDSLLEVSIRLPGDHDVIPASDLVAREVGDDARDASVARLGDVEDADAHVGPILGRAADGRRPAAYDQCWKRWSYDSGTAPARRPETSFW